MSAQRLALNNFLRSGPRIVTAPHHATIAVEGRDKDDEHEQHVPENVRLVEAVLPFVNFVRNVPRSIDVAQSWVPLHKFGNDSGNQSVDSCDSKTSKPLYLLDCQCDGTPTTPPPSRKNSTEKPSMTEIAVQTDERITFSGDFYANSRALKWELQNSIGEREMLDEEYDKAFERFKAAADRGCVEAMRNLAECYAHGLGCKKSHTRAFLWWDRASLGGDLEALYQSALCYLRGEGIAKSVVGGQKLMRSAADRGHPEACFYMTTLLFRENRAEEASRYVRGALEDEECEARLRKWLEMDDLSLPAQLVLHEHLRHEKDVEATVAKK